MATGYSQLNLNIKTTSDLAGINQLKQQLNEIRTLAGNANFTAGLDPTQIEHMVTSARKLDSALEAAFDVNLNTINIQKFNQSLKESGTSLQSIQAGLANAGTLGQKAFLNATNQLVRFNAVTKQTNGFLQSMATSFANTVRWSVMSSAIQGVTSSVRKAYGYIKDLDEALNDIRIVTGKSAEEMQKFAVSANDAAKALAVSTRDYTEGALIYYQQGLDDETVKTLTDVTAKTSNVTQQSMETVSEQLTAVWNGYRVANQAAKEGMGIYEEYVDKMAAVGATTASNLEELATAMSKVASAASSMGVGFDELNAQIATIVSVTRQAPESVGTALKTIYARLGDLQVDGVDEFGTKLGDVSGKLQMMGIDIIDTNGNMREMDAVMTEVAEKWGTWTEAQRQAAAVAMAGKRQYNNLIALFDNWDMYSKTLNTAQNAAGTLEEQQSIALDSLKNKLDILTATSEDFYDNLFDEESLKDLVEMLTSVMQGVSDVTESIGGLKSILPLLSSLLLKVFDKHIIDSVITFKNNLNATKNEIQYTAQAAQAMREAFPQYDFMNTVGGSSSAMNNAVKELVSYYEKMVPLKRYMNSADMETYNNIQQQKVALGGINIELEKQFNNWQASSVVMGNSKVTAAQLFGTISSLDDTGSFENLTVSVKQYDDALTILKNDLTGGLNAQDQYVNGTDKAQQAFDRFYASISKSVNKNALGQLQKEMQAFAGDLNNLDGQGIQRIIDKLQKLSSTGTDLVDIKNKSDSLTKSLRQMGTAFEESMNFKAMVTNVTAGIRSIGQLASSIQTLKNLGSIWNNEDLETGEKILQTIINLSFALPMLIMSFGKLSEIIGITQGVQFLMAKRNLATAISAYNAAKGQSAQAKAAEELTAATVAADTAQKTFNKTILANPYVLIATAIIAAVVATIVIFEKLNVTAEESAEMAAKSQQEIQESFKATKEAYDDLMSSVENYNEAQMAINKLTEGTQEWRDAIHDANEQVIKLIDKYPELAEAVERVEGGRLIFNDEKASEVLKKQAEELNKAERANYYASIRKRETQDYLEIQNLGQDIFYIQDNPQYATAYAGGVGTGANAVLNSVSALEMKHVIEVLNNSSAEIFASNEELKKATGFSNDKLIQALMTNKEKIIQLANSIDANTKANQLLLEQSAVSKIESSEFADMYETSQYQEQVSTLVANISKNVYDNQLKEVKKLSRWDSDKELHKAYAEAMGYNYANNTSSDEWGYGIFTDNQGNEIEIDDDTIREALATEYSINIAVENTDEFIQDMQILSSTGIQAGIEAGLSMTDSTELGDILAGFLGGESSVATATIEQKEALEEAIKSTDFSTLISEETLKAAGYETVSEFMSAIEAELENYNEEEAAALRKQKQLQEYNAAIATTAGTLEVSETALKGYTDALIDNNELLEENSTVAVDAAAANVSFAKGISSLQKALEDNLEILQTWNEDAFETYEAAEQVQNAIKEMFGVEVSADFVKENLDDLQNAIEGDEEAIDRLSKAAAKDFIIGLQLDESGTNAFNDIIDQLSNTDISIGAEVDLGNSIEEINRLLEAGQITTEQVNAAFESIGYKPNIEYTTQEGKPTTTTSTADISTRVFGKDVQLGTITSKTTSVSDISVPYITSGDTASKGKGGYGVKNSGASATRISTKSTRAGSIGSIATNAKKEKEDNFEEIYDRYWTINKALEEIEHTLEDLDEIQSHLHGKALIESLEKENKLLKEQEETYNRLYEAQKVEAAELRGQLSQYGVMFQDGNVINYDAAVKGLNASQYEAFQELFERYDELFYSEMVDTLNKIEEINYERLANELEAFEIQLELNLETTEAERALDEFTKELNKDFKSIYENFDQELAHIVKSYDTYVRKNGTIDSIISAIQTVQKEIDALRDNDDTTDSKMFATVGDAQEKLKELQEQLQDATLESRDLMEEYWDTYLDSIDQAAEKFEELSEEFDTINDELDYQRELIELIYGPEAYGMQKQIFDAQINNSLAQVDSARQQVDLWQSYYDQTEEGTEEQLKYAELLKEAQAELNDLTLEHIQLLKDDYANTMDDILTKLEKDITGGLGLDDMREEWEEAVKESEKYYDNIERIFELETLENKFQNAIDNTASPKYQQAIKDLMDDQLATLKDKEQLTEYDVQLAEKRLGILQAEAALEDAQNAKNAMKLVRGASGNWEYQYVADTSDIENKQQALRESYQELYEFAKDAQLDSIEALMEAKDDYITKLHEIADDETLTEEEKLIKVAEINDKYWNEEEGIITKLQQDYYNKTQTLSTASAESLLGLYEADKTAYYDMTEYEKGLVDEFKHHAETSYTDMYLAIQEEYKQDQEKFDSYVDSNLLHWQTAASGMAAAWNGDEDSIRTNVNEAYESISDATTEYSLELEKLEATSGDSFGEEGITGDIKTAIDYTNTLKTKTGELVDLANSRLPEYKTQIENIGTAWTNVAGKIDNASKQLKYYLELNEIKVPEPTISGDGSGSVGSGINAAPGGSSEGGGTPNKNTSKAIENLTNNKEKEEKRRALEKHLKELGGGTATVKGKLTDLDNNKKDTPPPETYVYYVPQDGFMRIRGYYDENLKADISLDEFSRKMGGWMALDTGGYTGDWSGGEGRVAMLHSKELVLNKVDTKNILNAVSAVRDMAGITSSVGSAIMQNIKAMIMEVLGISAGTGRATRNTNNETSNVFHITAEFPNANSVETIQEAILSLPNIASQYVAENRR